MKAPAQVAILRRIALPLLLVALGVGGGCDPAAGGPSVTGDGADSAVGGVGKAGGEAGLLEVALDPRGGLVALPGGGQLAVPPQAVDRPRLVTIRVVPPPTGSDLFAIGPFYELLPAGLPLYRPIEVSLPCDDACGRAHRVAIAWRDAAGGWAALPTRVVRPKRALTAQLSRLGRIGAAAFEPTEGACCLGDGRCAMTTAAQCDGAFVGRGVPCSDGDGATCTRVRCCADPSGHRFVLSGTCAGETVPADRCALVCCPTSVASPLAERVPRGDCPAGASPDPDACAPVCCELADERTLHRGVMFAADCAALAEAFPHAATDPHVADCPVCCADGWTRRPAGACSRWREPGLCERACCRVDGAVERTAIGDCLARGGAVAPDAACACRDDRSCDDGDPCTTDRCEPKDGRCRSAPVLGERCGDGCVTGGEACEHDAQCAHLGKGATCLSCRCVRPRNP